MDRKTRRGKEIDGGRGEEVRFANCESRQVRGEGFLELCCVGSTGGRRFEHWPIAETFKNLFAETETSNVIECVFCSKTLSNGKF